LRLSCITLRRTSIASCVDHRNGIYLDSLRTAFEASGTQLASIGHFRFRASHMRMWADLIRWYCGFEELGKDKENQDDRASVTGLSATVVIDG